MASILKNRIAAYGKYGVTSPDLSIISQYNAPIVVPLSRIQIQPGVILYEDTQPLITADGAPVTATGKGQWGQLYAAGRI